MRASITLGILLLVGYGIFSGRKIILGPSLDVTITEYDSYILFEGNSHSAQTVSINDRSIPISLEGDFSESLLKVPGYSIITLEAIDRFGKVRHRTYHFYSPLERETLSYIQYDNKENTTESESSL